MDFQNSKIETSSSCVQVYYGKMRDLKQASQSFFVRSSPLGQSRDKRELAEIFHLFWAKYRKQNFGISGIENAQNKINRDHFPKS